MKRFLAVLLLCWSWAAWAQPVLRNSYTTNSTGRTPNVLPTSVNPLFPLSVENPTGVGADRAISYTPGFSLTGTNMTIPGNLSLNGRTNRLSIVNDTLHLDGVPVTSTETTPVNNFYSTNNFFVSGKGNTLVVTQALTLQYLKTNLLSVDANGLVTTTKFGANISWDPATQTISASGGSGGGASVWIPNTALAYAGGTNVTISGAGGTNFYLTVTNTAFFTTPSEVPASASTNTSFTVFFKMDGTGGYSVTWTNGSFKWPGNSQFQPITNANAVSYVNFTMSPFTNGIFIGDYGLLDSR